MQKNNHKKIFLTGGNGFIGRNILERLGKRHLFLSPSAQTLDLIDEKAVYNFLKEKKVDVVLHTANVGGVKGEEEPPEAIFTNLKMFFNLTRAKPFYKKMIMFGSGAEYDKSRPIAKIKESDFGKRVPSDQYGFYKYVCSEYAEKTDFITHIRLFGVYGKYERYKTRFISSTICKILLGLPIDIGQNVYFDYIYANDLVDIVGRFIENDSKQKFYNIGTGNSVDLLTIAKKILQASGKNLPITVKNSGFNNEYTCDVSRLLSEFPDIRYTNFDQSIKELFKYYKLLLPKIKKEFIDF